MHASKIYCCDWSDFVERQRSRRTITQFWFIEVNIHAYPSIVNNDNVLNKNYILFNQMQKHMEKNITRIFVNE
jgi:hypothetical protein